jgi:hypothetical protein
MHLKPSLRKEKYKTKSRLQIVACAALAVVASVAVSAAPQEDSVKIASLVNDMKSMDFGQLEALRPVDVKSLTLPGPSVDVMRVRLEETYTIDGVGKDTVALTGWIAVRHGASRPAPGETLVSWATAVTDTEFVGLELRGQSDVFGPVHVTLDSSRPAIGQVGKIDIPERSQQILLAANEAPKGESEAGAVGADATAKNCRAPVNVKVAMSDLGLEMITKTPAVWYSRVTTIPPVGHIASVTTEPVSLVSADREVGKLVSGTVKFREVVRAVPLSRDHEVRVAP